MKFKSPTDKPIYLAMTSGHTCTIGPELAEVDPRFHRQALVEGAILEGTEHIKVAEAGAEKTKSELILEAVRAMVDAAEPDDFANDGKVKATALSKRLGFTVSSLDRDAAWQVVAEEA